MSNTIVAAIISIVILSVTLLVALGKIDPVYLTTVIGSVIAWLIPSPIAKKDQGAQ